MGRRKSKNGSMGDPPFASSGIKGFKEKEDKQ